MQCSVDVEDLSDEAKKIDYIHHRVKYLHFGLRSMKCALKQKTTDATFFSTTARQEIKMGFIAHENDDEMFSDSFFKSNVEMSLQKHIRQMRKRGEAQEDSSRMVLQNGIMMKKKSLANADQKRKAVGWHSKFQSHTKVLFAAFRVCTRCSIEHLERIVLHLFWSRRRSLLLLSLSLPVEHNA